MGVHGGRTGAQLTISDALTTGYKFLLRPEFSIPILVIGVVVNLIAVSFIAPFVTKIAVGDAVLDMAIIGALIGSLLASLIVGTIGGIILNLYGMVWATMAVAGEPPTMQAAFARVGERWMNILGAGLITGGITLGAMIVIGLVSAALGGIGVIVFIAGVVALIYVGIRLSMSGWLAADGAGAMDAVKGSWELTNRHLMTIVVWSIVVGVVVAVITAVAGAILGLIPVIGSALTQTLASAFGFGASVTIFRRVKDA